ncbi:MAG: hypothetical protein A2005_09955 [Desulfuromonadales bacterium GWC2_61_20]|nr:MAG: hypothetical protein A2005_09955 [Desulfuromonadales bacterium GWC2_61_20]HAD04210.1 hypothetical protein [Desulfuromonas sp.]
MWGHYSWDASFKADGTDADTFPDKDRVDCQRCHTATGIKNFLTSPAAYDPAKNDFSHLSGWSGTVTGTIIDASTWGITTGSGQNELLYCWGCHSDLNAGALRNPGAITEVYTAISSATTGTTGTSVTVVYPDASSSNVCMGCHLGREVGANITNTTDGIGTNPGDVAGQLAFINSHYLTAGATIFNESGYEYAGQVYNNLGYHKNIGMADTAGTGTAGPCVICHMQSAAPHTFGVVTKNATGTITAVASTICVNCHGAMTPAVLEAEKEEFHLAMNALLAALDAKGIYFYPAHPYFYKDTNANGIFDLGEDVNRNGVLDAGEDVNANGILNKGVDNDASSDAFTSWESVATSLGVGLAVDPTGLGWKNVMGAAYNYNLFEHDPGAYAHNRTYSLSLIRDSIDFLNDGLVDGDSSIVRTMVRAGFDVGTVDSSANPLHAAAIASVGADPSTGLVTCAGCHKAAAHFGGNATATGSTPAQWVAPFNNVYKPCTTCHAGGVIGANAAILDQYATANHGDVNGAWNHVNTTAPTITVITGPGAGSYQTWCGRCHTSKGFVDQAGASSSNTAIPLWPTVAGQTMLDAVACDACHTDVATGATHVLGAFTTSYYSAATAFNVAVNKTYADAASIGPSAICTRCHSGRDSSGIGQLIKDGTPAAAATVLRTHYLGSGLTLFNTGGYHFGATDYTNLGSHKGIGALGVGPCVTCHMSNAAGARHTFWPIEEDETTGAITAVLSDQCGACHGVAMTAAYLTEVRNDFKTVKNALETALQAKGIFYRNELETGGSTGRFYSSAAHTTELTFSSTTPSYSSLAATYTVPPTGQDLMGAAFNLAFVDYIQEPGAYVHNWEYARKLLIDSIDLVADGVIDGIGIPAAVVAIDAKYPSL